MMIYVERLLRACEYRECVAKPLLFAVKANERVIAFDICPVVPVHRVRACHVSLQFFRNILQKNIHLRVWHGFS